MSNPDVTRIRELADVIGDGRLLRERGVGFNMRHWIANSEEDATGHFCKTVACVGGTAEILWRKDPNSDGEYEGANHLLLLSFDQAEELFHPSLIEAWSWPHDRIAAALRLYADALEADPAAMPDWDAWEVATRATDGKVLHGQ